MCLVFQHFLFLRAERRNPQHLRLRSHFPSNHCRPGPPAGDGVSHGLLTMFFTHFLLGAQSFFFLETFGCRHSSGICARSQLDISELNQAESRKTSALPRNAAMKPEPPDRLMKITKNSNPRGHETTLLAFPSPLLKKRPRGI